MKKEIDANELFELIKKFIHISINSIAGSKPGEFSKNYRNTKIKVSFYSMHGGNSKFQNAPTFTFLNYGQKVTHGIYPIIHLNRKDPVDNFTIAYGISEKTQPEILWNNSTLKKLESNGSNSLYYTYVQTVKSEDDINANKDEIIKTINEMIDNYHKTFNGEIQMPEEPATDKPKFPLNQILYGPPGTGKTYNTKDIVNKILAGNTQNTSTANYDFSDITWHEAIALGMYNHHKNWYNTAELKIMPEVQMIYEIKNNKNLHNALWTYMQQHTSPEIETVKYAKRYEPYLFVKNKNSQWGLTEFGKKYVEENLSTYIQPPEQNENVEYMKFITFHQSYAYEDFVEGIKPECKDNTVTYNIQKGIFKEMCLNANSDPNNNYVIIIDEINRGNISKIFGELITLIEDDKRITPNGEYGFENTKLEGNQLLATLPYSQKKFGVPKNLYIIGTMNTSDRSIASIDIALRRRFKFVEMMPKPEKLVDKNNQPLTVDGINLQNILEILNNRISYLLDRDHQIGHSYFMNWTNYDDITTFKDVWFDSILPLLNEYFYSDWDKLQAILGAAENENTFIIKIPRPELPYSNNCADEECNYDFSKKENTSNEQFKKMLEKANLIAGIKND